MSSPFNYQQMLDALLSTIKGWIQDKIDLASTYRDEAQAARQGSLTYRNSAQTAQGAAETARDEALAAKVAAEATKMVWQGAWSGSTAYAPRSIVSYQGASWYNLESIPANQADPASNAKWLLLAARGEPGQNGSADWADITNKPTEFPPAAHKTAVPDIDTTNTATSTTFLRGDKTWATPTNTTYSVPTQAEAEAGTATTGRAFSSQRVRQAADAAITARQWTGTQAEYDAITTKDPNVIYNIVE